jgi:hypothetical protein
MEPAIVDRAAEIERLRTYPHAYVVVYGRPCGS